MANISIGIIGLPNVGKSTLFRALTSIAVPAEKYPFCTIDPNVGVVEVPDARLDRLHQMLPPRNKVPPVVEFMDIAGLVKGASRGEGLGNRFLHHVREADALVHVVRVFEAGDVASASDSLDPIDDLITIDTELALADLEVVDRNLDKLEKLARSGDKEAARDADLLRRLDAWLNDGKAARSASWTADERATLRPLNLLTLKPTMYVLNVGEEHGGDSETVERLGAAVAERDPGAECLTICAELEAEIHELADEERGEFLEALGLEEEGLDRLIRAGYRLLGLQTFFTIGDAEVRGWTLRTGAHAPEAAGKVHTDFERGFIRAETIHFGDFEGIGSLKDARERGLLRSEGKEYLVQDGDILFFRAAP
jgi:GTP-binding protein YchF